MNEELQELKDAIVREHEELMKWNKHHVHDRHMNGLISSYLQDIDLEDDEGLHTMLENHFSVVDRRADDIVRLHTTRYRTIYNVEGKFYKWDRFTTRSYITGEDRNIILEPFSSVTQVRKKVTTTIEYE